ncbi:inositol polyphosphate multikinase [Salvia divinorum]|uniref:Inositol polyphosphate multikinase n=1 Tax=Salvia divinorum TaxID=28513 RepID=A0ABD1HRE9_SALDI
MEQLGSTPQRFKLKPQILHNPGKSMLKVPDHQVAGHKAGDGRLGPLVDDSGRFYKPLQGDERGANELSFYTSFSSNTKIPDHITTFFPKFDGTQLVEASDGSGRGLHKLQRTTLTELGYWEPENRSSIQTLSADEVKLLLKSFVSSNTSEEPHVKPDCAFASTVYGGSTGILSQLLELKAWFEDQTIYHFYSSSVLMMFEKELASSAKSPQAEIKLVDFAHVRKGKGVIDHNFLVSMRLSLHHLLFSRKTLFLISIGCIFELKLVLDGLSQLCDLHFLQ